MDHGEDPPGTFHWRSEIHPPTPYPAKAPEHPLLRMQNQGKLDPTLWAPGIHDSWVPSMGSADSPRMPTSDPSMMRGEPGWVQRLAVHFCPLPCADWKERGRKVGSRPDGAITHAPHHPGLKAPGAPIPPLWPIWTHFPP